MRVLEGSLYKEALVQCWGCGHMTHVYDWVGHVPYDEKLPPQPIPKAVKFLWCQQVHKYVWLNECESCGLIQGDWYLYVSSEGVFSISNVGYSEYEKLHGGERSGSIGGIQASVKEFRPHKAKKSTRRIDAGV